jgi:NDP-sugar pyrophosphorylase family protein
MVAKYSKAEQTQDMVYIDYGAVIFRKEVLQLIPENRFSPLEDLFIRLIGIEQLLAFEVTERFYEIGSPSGLRDFEEFARRHIGR